MDYTKTSKSVITAVQRNVKNGQQGIRKLL